MTTFLQTDESQNARIDSMAALDGMASAGLVLTARGQARCCTALAGIRAITDILFQLEIDKECTGGIQASNLTTTGLIQALAVCADYVDDHMNGTTEVFAQTINSDTPAYAELSALHERARKEAA